MTIPAEASALRPAALARTRSAWADYLEMTKPGITGLVLITTSIGFFMATHGAMRLDLLVHTLLATAMVAGGASVLNQYLERGPDALMRRTNDRPLPGGRVRPASALRFGVLLSAGGVLYLSLAANLLAGATAALTVLLYVFVYTPLKRVTPLSTIVGAIPGALPPVGGWAAASGSVTSATWILFTIVFLWQLPHFLAIGWLYRDDYARGGFFMLPVLDREARVTSRHTVAWTAALIPVSLAPTPIGLTGVVYFAGALILGAAYLASSLSFAARRTDSPARRLFLVSFL